MPEPTTIEELRDWHARRKGLVRQYTKDGWYYMPTDSAEYTIAFNVHPIADTIDAAVLVLPEVWGMWDRNTSTGFMSAYRAIPDDQDDPRSRLDFIRAEVKLTGHTPEAIRRDLLALARLAWIAEGAEP